jgi:sugar phosphate isomerase/epimerase
MFQLAFNTNGLRTLDLPDAVSAIARAGYQGVELSLHPRHIDPDTFTRADADSLRALIQDQGLAACCLATGADNLLSSERFEPSLIHPTCVGRQRRLDLLHRAIDFAGWLGVPVMSLASGVRKPEVEPRQAEAWLLDGLRECLNHAGDSLTLAIEPEPDFFLQTNDATAALIHELGSPRLSINVDIGHANVVEDDYLNSIARALPMTSHIHVEDIKQRRHFHEIPGDGDLDFPALYRILREQSYSGFLSVELYNHADTWQTSLTQSLVFLRNVEAQERAAA